MRATLALAATGIRQIAHQKLLYNLLVFAFAFVLAALALVHMTIGQWERLITDMGVSAIGISSALIAIFVGAGLIAGEVDRKTIYFVLSKPVSRTQFVLARFLSLLAVIVLNAAVMLAVVCAMLAANEFTPTSALFAAALGGLLEATVLAGFALFFSTFTTTTLAAIFTTAIFVTGHVLGTVDYFSQRASPSIRAVGVVARALLPDFALLNFKPQAVDGLAVHGAELLHATAYGMGYAGVVLIAAAALFSQRDFR